MAPRKRTGQIGPTAATWGPGGANLEWKKIKFSSDKTEIEDKIVSMFQANMAKSGLNLPPITRNSEYGFDYTVGTFNSKTDLELTEFIYSVGKGKGDPFAVEHGRINGYDFARRVCWQVTKKSKRYGKRSSSDRVLLIYITEWKFDPSETTIRLIQQMLIDMRPNFGMIVFLQPFDEADCTIRILYPSDNPLEGRSLEEFRDHHFYNISPGSAFIIAD